MMNERIKELALQAGLSEGRFERYEGQDCDLKGYSMLPEQMQKFAELIVLDVLAKKDSRWCDGDIKQHFGVEL